jgi:hypothetical protein
MRGQQNITKMCNLFSNKHNVMGSIKNVLLEKPENRYYAEYMSHTLI